MAGRVREALAMAQGKANGRREGGGRRAWEMPDQGKHQPEGYEDLSPTEWPALYGDQDQ